MREMFRLLRYNCFIMMRAYLYHSQSNDLKKLDAAGVLAEAPSDADREREATDKKAHAREGGFSHTLAHCRIGELLWIDMTAPDEADYELLMKRFSLHPMVIEDIKSREGRPKLHDYGDYLYIIFHALSYDAQAFKAIAEEALAGEGDAAPESVEEVRAALHMCEIDCLVGPDYVVTLHPDPLQPFDDLCKRWERRPELMKSGASYLLYEVMDEILDEYFPLLDALDDQIDDFEDRLFQEFQEHLSAEIFALKRCLLQVRRIAGPTRDVVNILLRRDADSGGKHFAYFQDLYDHSVRIVDMVDTFRDILSGALDAYLAMASNRMNAVMKTLTSASIILLIPTLIAGVYGMNFDNMPELHSPYGYHATIAVMVTTMVALGILFKRKKWL